MSRHLDTSGPGVRVPDSGTLGRESSSVVDTLDRVRGASVRHPIRPPGLLLVPSELSLPFPMLIQICSLPPSSRCPQGPPALGHLGTARLSSLGHSLSTCACSPSLPFQNTCATVCQSPGGHLAIEHKRVPRVLPRSTLLGPTWTPDTCPHTQ